MSANQWKFSAAVLTRVEEQPDDTAQKTFTVAWYGTAILRADNQELDLVATWESQQGALVFVPVPFSEVDNSEFTAKLTAYLKATVRKHLSLLWLKNPLAPIQQWQASSVSTVKVDNDIQVSQLSYLDIRNYSFSVAKDTTVVFNGSTLEFHRADDNAYAFELAANFGRYRLYDIGDTVTLPVTDPQAGCIQFDLSVKKEEIAELPEGEQQEGATKVTYGYPALTPLDLSLRMFMRDPNFPESGNDFYVNSHRYPFFNEINDDQDGKDYYRASIEFRGSWDLLDPQNAARCYLSLKHIVDSNPEEDELEDLGYPTGYRTNLGYTIHVVPTTSSKFVFTPRPDRLNDAGKAAATYYLAPSGAFNLIVPRYNAEVTVDIDHEDSMICGISGVEYLKISGKEGSVLHFIPEQAAYLPNYSSVSALIRDLGTIIESYSTRDLPENTTDLDMLIEDKEEGESNEAMGITDVKREEMLNLIRLDYFPPGYQFTQKAKEEYMNLEIVEDLVHWLRNTLQSVMGSGAVSDKILTEEVTTSWAYLTDERGAIYYAQPDQAILYKADSSDKKFLDFMEVPSVGLPTALAAVSEAENEIKVLAFPMLPYGGVDQRELTDIRQLEIQLISNYRRSLIQQISANTGNATPLISTTEGTEGENIIHQGTTPQGLLATYNDDYTLIKELMLAKDTANQEIKLVNIEHGSALKASLQSNQLFMVISDADAIANYFSTEALAAYLEEEVGEELTATNRLTIAEWIFELGPYGQKVADEAEEAPGELSEEEVTDDGAIKHWEKKGTILIFKFHDKPLIELVDDPNMWSFAGEFNEDQYKTSKRLKKLLIEAIESGNSEDAKERSKYEVLARAATYAGWSGVLAFNVDVPLGNLPDSLKALAAGIDASQFYSQYVGIEVTQIDSTGTELVPQQSSLFGLIDYQNNNVPLADPEGFNFHVKVLTVVFRNSQITDFAAEVLLIIDKLFDEKTTLLNSPDGRNILSLKGVAEEHNGKTTYSFGFSGVNRFQLSRKVIQEVEVVRAQFATDPVGDADPVDNLTRIRGRFTLWGRMRFVYLEGLDILSFGAYPAGEEGGDPEAGDTPNEPDYLNMSNLQVVMTFKLNEASGEVSDKAFTFDPNQITYDLERSGWRTHSLYEKFPLKFKTLRYVNGDEAAFGNSGFMPVNTGLRKTLAPNEIGGLWYGMIFDLNMGSIGSLAGGAGLTVGVMAAWKPAAEGLYIGLKLPGSSGGKKEISIQGVLKIVFKHIQFTTYPLLAGDPQTMTPAERQQVGYLLKLNNIVIKFFVVSFPPVGKTEIILFGDPRSEIERKDRLVGWYASYAKK